MVRKLLYLFRHGETDWNLQKRFQGRTSHIPLNEKGISQAKMLAESLAGRGIQGIYSSPLMRAKLTAETVSDALNLPIEWVEDLQERSFGEVEGLTFEDMLAKDKGFESVLANRNSEFVTPTYDPKAESLADTQKRIYSAIQKIAQESPYERIGISTHAAVLFNFLIKLLERDDFEHIANGELVVIEYNTENMKFSLKERLEKA